MRIFGWTLGRKVKTGDVWRMIYKDSNPFESEEFVDRTVIEIRNGFAKCSRKYSDGLAPQKPEVLTISELKEYSKLLNREAMR